MIRKVTLPALLIALSCCQPKTQEPALPQYLQVLAEEWQSAGSNFSIKEFEKSHSYSAEQGDLQDFLDSLSGNTNKIVRIQPGIYELDTALIVPSNMILEGVERDKVTFVSKLKYPFKPEPFDTPCTIEFLNVSKAGLKNITLIYEAVDFPTYSPSNFYDLWDKRVFKNDPEGDTLLYVGHIGVKNSENIFIDNCRVLHAGTDPIIIAGSNNVTVSNSIVDGSYNKGGKGNGYFNIDKGSHHVLVQDNRIEKIRHLAIQKDTHHNVIVDNDMEVDVNFHNGDDGSNLIEGNVIRIPEWHGWHCISAGAKSKHDPPGPNNYIFNNHTQYKLFIPEIREKITEYGDSIIYTGVEVVDSIAIKDQLMVRYSFTDYKKANSKNLLFRMNDEWDNQKSVLLADTLLVNRLFR